MTADPLAAALARTREQLRRAEDELAELRAERVILRAQLRDRGYVDVELPEQTSDPCTRDLVVRVTAPTPWDAVRWLGGIRELVEAEFGDTMQLEFRTPRRVEPPEQRDEPPLSDVLTPRQEFEELLQVHGWPEEQA